MDHMLIRLSPILKSAVAVAHSFRDPQPVKRGEWPAWARDLKAESIPGEQGVGDTAERIIGPVGGAAFKRLVKHCGCGARKENLNQEYPY